MPLSMTFLLKTLEDIPEKRWSEKLSKALFISIIKAVGIPAWPLDKGPSPFTISPIMPAAGKSFFKSGNREQRLNTAGIMKGERFHFRITCLEDQYVETFIEWIPSLILHPLSVEVEDMAVLVEGAQSSPGLTDKWNGSVCYRKLYTEASDSLRNIILKFYSSTALRRREGVSYPLPDPFQIFSGYFSLWEVFSGLPLDVGLRPALKKQFALVDFRLRKRSFMFEKEAMAGFVGSATFRLQGRHPESVLKGLNVLADYSFFCGTGLGTEKGMGMTRRIKQGSREDFTSL